MQSKLFIYDNSGVDWFMPNTGADKYNVKLSFKVDGIVERTDIIGAIFGQTEGLLGPEMNLNELQRASKVGRIEVDIRVSGNVTSGEVNIPMSTDIDPCALIAAAIESIEKVGPFDCSYKLISLEDIRAVKKDDIVRRAKEIKQRWATKTISEGESMIRDIHQGASRTLASYGPSKLTCGSGVYESNWIILVEGRADVINLLRAGYDNAIAIEGAKIDDSIKDLCSAKEKIVAFTDGDRAGGFILKGLKSVVTVDYELRADPGMEVEELTPLRIDEILRPIVKQIESGDEPAPELSSSEKAVQSLAASIYPKLKETLEAVALDESQEEIFRVPINELVRTISTQSNVHFLFLDGIITQRLLDGSRSAGVQYIVGHRVAKVTNADGVALTSFADLDIR